MFDLMTIQVMNYASHIRGPESPYLWEGGSPPERNAIYPCAINDAIGLLEEDAARGQVSFVEMLDDALPRPITHEQWENSRWKQCGQCGKLYEINHSDGSSDFTCSDVCAEGFVPF